jgi:hypothetical protein
LRLIALILLIVLGLNRQLIVMQPIKLDVIQQRLLMGEAVEPNSFVMLIVGQHVVGSASGVF